LPAVVADEPAAPSSPEAPQGAEPQAPQATHGSPATEDADTFPSIQRGSSLCIEEFRTASRIVRLGQSVDLTWRTSNAQQVVIRARAPGAKEAEPLDTRGFLGGQLSYEPAGDTEFVLEAYDGDVSDTRTISIVTIRSWRPPGVLAAMLIAVGANWYVSQGLFAATDAVENDPRYLNVNRAREVFALITAVIGAPMIVTVARLRTKMSIHSLSTGILRSGLWSGLLVAACLLQLWVAVRLGCDAHVIRLDNRLSRSVELQGPEDARVALVVPPGLSSALVFHDPRDFTGGEGHEPEGVDIECAKHGDSTCGRLRFECKRSVEVSIAGNDDDRAVFSVSWDDGKRAAASEMVATRDVDDCASFPSTATIELRTQDERLRFDTISSLADTKSQHVGLERLELGFPHETTAYATVWSFPDWTATGDCQNGKCQLTIPSGGASTASACVSTKRSADGGGDCDTTIGIGMMVSNAALLRARPPAPDIEPGCKDGARLGSLELCVPPTIDDDTRLMVDQEGFAW
jgi:hypothetical protein